MRSRQTQAVGEGSEFPEPARTGPRTVRCPLGHLSLVTYLLVCVCVSACFFSFMPDQFVRNTPSPALQGPGRSRPAVFDPDGCHVRPSYAGVRLGIRR
ncbi:hypothetical protein CGRA01v4_01120 [Colletotrichum graminicola]|nr:hypothetical protein CGRA01v4_01120 [Colletotrichum graminicola]